MVEVVAYRLVDCGRARPSQAALSWATAVLWNVGLHKWFRPGELYWWAAGDFSFGLSTGGEPIIVTIKEPKNRGALSRAQVRIVSNVEAEARAAWYCAGLPLWARIGPANPRWLRELWDLTLESQGLGSMGFTPEHLRPFGATELFRAGVPVSSIEIRGG